MMKKRPSWTIYWTFLMALALCCIAVASPTQAAINWNEFSQSLGGAFSEDKVLSLRDIFYFLLTIFVLVLPVIISRNYWSKERREIIQHENQRKQQLESDVKVTKQRRKWFRLQTSQLFKWFPSSRALTAREKLYNEDQLLDISGGGLSFVTHTHVSAGDELTFIVDIGDYKPLNIRGKVVRVIVPPETDLLSYQVAIQFGDLLSGERDRLVSWIIKGQRSAIHEAHLGENAQVQTKEEPVSS